MTQERCQHTLRGRMHPELSRCHRLPQIGTAFTHFSNHADLLNDICDSHYNGPFEKYPTVPATPWMRRAVAPFEETIETVRLYGTQKAEAPAVVTATCTVQQSLGRDAAGFASALSVALRLPQGHVFVFEATPSGTASTRVRSLFASLFAPKPRRKG